MEMPMIPETIILDFGYSNQSKKNKLMFEKTFSKSRNLTTCFLLGQTHAGNTLRSVLSILENPEYRINNFQKARMALLDFSIPAMEFLPPTLR